MLVCMKEIILTKRFATVNHDILRYLLVDLTYMNGIFPISGPNVSFVVINTIIILMLLSVVLGRSRRKVLENILQATTHQFLALCSHSRQW